MCRRVRLTVRLASLRVASPEVLLERFSGFANENKQLLLWYAGNRNFQTLRLIRDNSDELIIGNKDLFRQLLLMCFCFLK